MKRIFSKIYRFFKNKIKRYFVITKKIENKSNIPLIKVFLNSLNPIKTEYELIRVGGINDGGYLLPNDLYGLGGLISPGVGGSSSFELFFAELMPCYLIDPTIDKLPTQHKNFEFIKKFLGVSNDETTVSLDKLINEISPKRDIDLILQMDIEGFEWDVLKNINKNSLNNFRIMVIEFHGFHKIFNDTKTLSDVIKLFNEILDEFSVVHIHNNNCCNRIKIDNLYFSDLVEITFLRNDRIIQKFGHSEIPNKLDEKNVKRNKDFKLKLK